MRRSRSSAPAAVGLVVAGGAWIGCAPAAPTPVAPAAAACPSEPVVITSQADITRLARCTTLRGLTIRTGAALDLAKLHALTAITGELVIGPTVAVEDVTLDALRVVDGAIRVVGNGLLQGVFLPRLERAGAITVDGNVALTTLSLPRVTAIGTLRATDNASLELIDLPVLTALATLVIASDPKLTLIESAELRSLGHLELDGPRLPAELVERLRALAH